MNARERHLVTWLVILSDQLPTFVNEVLAADVPPQRWNEFADILAGGARMCRERAMVTIDARDSGAR